MTWLLIIALGGVAFLLCVVIVLCWRIYRLVERAWIALTADLARISRAL